MSTGNKSVNDTVNVFFFNEISILLISNRNSPRVLFDKIASIYFEKKYINILALEMASPGKQHCQLYQRKSMAS